MKKILPLLLILALFSLACRVSVDLFDPPPLATPLPNQATATPGVVFATFTPTPNLATVTPLPIPPTLTPIIDTPALTAEQLKNASYTVTDQNGAPRVVQLVNGLFQEGTDPASPGFYTVVLAEPKAFGDINGDGAVDAAVILAESYGGTGVFVSVAAVVNQGGLPLHVASQGVDDRAIINAIAINAGEIFLNATVHGINDPGCCPTLVTARSLRLWQGDLVLSSYSTQAPNGANRVITIDTPANGTEVEKIFNVRGTCTIAPFENNLSYAVYIPAMDSPFTQGGLMVSAADFGAPCTFDLALNFTAAGYTGPVRIVLSDLSAADGSTLAEDALFITVK